MDINKDSMVSLAGHEEVQTHRILSHINTMAS